MSVPRDAPVLANGDLAKAQPLLASYAKRALRIGPAGSGQLAKMYDKWFVQPIPPSNTKVGLPLSDATKAAWNNPNTKPMEEYATP